MSLTLAKLINDTTLILEDIQVNFKYCPELLEMAELPEISILRTIAIVNGSQVLELMPWDSAKINTEMKEENHLAF